MPRAETPACAFGPFELDPSEHRLLRDGDPVPLTPKVFDVLCVLVRDHGRLVSKERLLEEVWPDSFVDEANLNRCVSILRKALGERAGEPRYIETVPKVGYRFSAPVIVHADGKRRRRSAAAIASLVATGILAPAVLVYVISTGGGSEPEPANAAAAPSHRQLTFTGREGLPAISPDGKRLAFVSSDGAIKRLMVQAVDGGRPVELFSGSGIGFVRWSPDNGHVLFWARTPEWEGVFLTAAPNGTPQRFARAAFVAAWSPDGETIAVAKYLSGRVTFFNREGVEQRAFTLQGDHFWISDMDWSPAGDRLLVASSDEQGRNTIWTVRPDGQEQQTVLQDRAEIDSARWSPRGDAIHFSRRANQAVTLLTLPMDGGIRRAGSAPATLLNGLEMDRTFGITADGRHLVYARASFHSNLWRADLDPSRADQAPRTRQLTEGTSLIERPRISPDGASILFNMGRESLAELYSMPMSGGPPKALTHLEAFSIGGVWSADGRRIAFASTKGGVPRVWTVDAGGGAPRPLSAIEVSNSFDLAWHPGARILFHRPGNRDYLEIDPERGADARPLAKDAAVGWMFSPVASPDGRRLAVSWNRRGGRGIWTIDRSDGREALVMKSGDGSLTPIGWSADGSGIYAVEGQAGEYRGLVAVAGETVTKPRILLITLRDGRAQPVAVLPFTEVGGVSMAPGGRQFVCTVYSSQSDVWIVDLLDSLSAL